MEARWHQSMDSIDADGWNALAQSSPTPLMSHEWLSHLETSGSITAEHGWLPRHLTLHESGRMVAAIPLYLRDSSWGEFVFDFAFAEVAAKIGSEYYPKLVGMSPATPSPAFHPLLAIGRESELIAAAMDEIEMLRRDERFNVLQFNYVIPEWSARLAESGLVAWEHHGYEWRNESFDTFDDYLARFRKNQRRNVRRERESMAAQGLAVFVVNAAEAPDHYMDRMADFYMRTNAQFGPWAARFLTRRFFTAMPMSVRQHVWLSCAVPLRELSRHGIDPTPEEAACLPAGVPDRAALESAEPVAMAMLVRKNDRVLGRYWGSASSADNLHFTVCYYAPIEWAIREGIAVFDPGMGSQHKVRRGFRSVPTISMHRFYDDRMQAILRANIGRINSYEQDTIRMLDSAVPYKEPGTNS